MSAMTIAIDLVATNAAGGAFASLVGQIMGLNHALGGLKGLSQDQITQLGGLGLAAGATGALFAAMFGVMKKGISDAGDLEMALTRLELAAGLGQDAFDNLKKSVVDLATHSLYSATEAAGAFEKLTEMGFTASQVMYGMGAAEDAVTSKSYDATAALQGVGRQGMAVGEAMQTDAVTGVTLLGSALHVFQSEGLSAADAANILVGAFYNGVPSANDLQAAINNAGAMASAAGVKLQDFTTILDMLGKAGLPAAQAGTSLRYMIQSLIAPTNKQAKALAELGIQVTQSNGYLQGLQRTMEGQGKAAAKAAKGYDGSVASLQDLFKAAQKAGDVPLDETFNQWAEKNQLLNSKLFDSKGQFLGLQNAIDVLNQAMTDKSMSMQQKMDIITQLFNVRSGRAAQILTNLQQFDSQYKSIWDKIGKTNALANAQKVLDTFKGSVAELGTSVQSALSEAFMPLIQNLTPLVQGINNLVGAFLNLDPSVQGTVGIIFALVTGLVGLASAILGAVFIGSVFAALGVSIGGILAAAAPIIGIVVGVIAALVLVFLATKTALEQNKPLMQFIQGIIALIGQWVGILWQKLQDLWKTLQGLTTLWNILKVVLAAVGIILLVVVLGAVLLIVGIFIVLAVAINVVIQVIGWLLGKLGDFFGFILGKLGGLKDSIPAIWSAITGFFVDAWNTITGKVGDAIQWIKDTIHNGFQWVQDRIHDAINFVVGLFSWLYNHNYYFQWLVDTIRHDWQLIQQDAAAIWNAITGFITGVWKWLGDNIFAKAGQIKDWIVQKFTEIKQWLGDTWKAITKTVSDAWNNIVKTVQTAISNFLKAIDNATKPARDAIGNVIQAIKDAITGLINNMKQWGANALQMFIDGITSKLGALGGVLGNVGGKIASVLGFHSPPKEGPLADSDQYMPNMMKMYATGITDHMPLLSRALTGVTGLVAGQLNGLNSQVITPNIAAAVTSGVLGSSGQGQVVIPINMDGKQIAQYTLDLQTKQLKQSGISRMAR